MKLQLFALLAVLGLAQPGLAAEKIVLQADPWCPHTCEAQASQPGYMVEIAKAAFAARGHQVEYRTVPWARAIADVRAGKVAGAIGALRTEAQDLVVHHEPLGRQANAMAVRAGDAWVFKGLGSLDGKVVGAILDYSYSPEIDAWLSEHKAGVRFTGGENALARNLRMLASGRLDVVVEDEAVLLHQLRSSPERDRVRIAGRMGGGDLFIAFAHAGGRGVRLAHDLDQGIRDLRASGELQRILASYGLRDWKAQP